MHCGMSFLCLGGSTFTIVFINFSISYMFLLLFLGSSSTRNSGNVCLVSYLLMLLIDLTWCPIFASSSLIFSVFDFGCNPLITVFVTFIVFELKGVICCVFFPLVTLSLF